jgi:hypothetical protein
MLMCLAVACMLSALLRSAFSQVSLIGWWLIPAYFALIMHWWLFVTIWVVFSACTLYVFYMCMSTAKLKPSIPRRVFAWFLYTHNVCIAIGAAGYAFFLLEILGAQPLVTLILGKGGSLNLLVYGLYFGILGRDAAEIASTGLVRIVHESWSTKQKCPHHLVLSSPCTRPPPPQTPFASVHAPRHDER